MAINVTVDNVELLRDVLYDYSSNLKKNSGNSDRNKELQGEFDDLCRTLYAMLRVNNVRDMLAKEVLVK